MMIKIFFSFDVKAFLKDFVLVHRGRDSIIITSGILQITHGVNGGTF